MAFALRMMDPIERSGLSTLVCLVRDEFSLYCARYMGELIPSTVLTAESTDDAVRLLQSRSGEGLLTAPATIRDAYLDDRLDHAGRTMQAAFLPVTLKTGGLIVGPLLGTGRSCQRCWRSRGEHLLDFDSTVTKLGQTGSVNTAAFLAAAMVGEVSRTQSPPFTSTFWKFDAARGEASWGMLTSSPQCEQCTRAFQRRRNSEALNIVLRLCPEAR